MNLELSVILLIKYGFLQLIRKVLKLSLQEIIVTDS